MNPNRKSSFRYRTYQFPLSEFQRNDIRVFNFHVNDVTPQGDGLGVGNGVLNHELRRFSEKSEMFYFKTRGASRNENVG